MEIIKVFWTSYMLGYLMEPIKDNEDFKEAVRNVKKGPKGPKLQKGYFSKETAMLTHFFKANRRTLKCYELLIFQGT